MLFERFPAEAEGLLARRHTALVRQETLARVARDLGLDALMRLSVGESDLGGRDNPALLCDVCESVLGALYLDAGYQTTAVLVRRLGAPDGHGPDPAQGRQDGLAGMGAGPGPALPVYETVATEGPDHAPTFTVSVRVKGEAPAQATGPSKRQAGHAAAAALVERLTAKPRSAGIMIAPETTRCGFVAVMGAPNAGKSTLVNTLVGTKVTIVSPKVQTTRSRVRGIALKAVGPDRLHRHARRVPAQAAAGTLHGRGRLGRRRRCRPGAGGGGCRARAWTTTPRPFMDGLRPRRGDWMPAGHQQDRHRQARGLLALAAALDAEGLFERVFMISALKADGTDDLLAWLAERAPEGPWMFDADDVSDLPQRMWAAEITREKLYLQLHQELPYASAVETEAWTERPDGSVRVDQVIYVQRDSQRAIVLGKGGSRVRAISTAARQEMAALLERPVHLFCTSRCTSACGRIGATMPTWGLDFDA